jgi:hypothetical protein
VFAIVGIRTQSSVWLSAPVQGAKGFARAKYDGRTGLCLDKGGSDATRRVIVAAHNLGLAATQLSGNYLFAIINIA